MFATISSYVIGLLLAVIAILGSLMWVANHKVENLQDEVQRKEQVIYVQKEEHKVKVFEDNQTINKLVKQGKPYEEINTSIGHHTITFK